MVRYDTRISIVATRTKTATARPPIVSVAVRVFSGKLGKHQRNEKQGATYHHPA
jgi:hypothetical protein